MDLNTIFMTKRKPELEKDALELGLPRRTRSMWNGRGSVNPLTEMESPNTTSRNESQSVHQQRNSNLSRLFAACNTAPNPGRPKNAADLATSLVKLVIPYDLANTQRSLVKVQDRLKAIETNAQKSDAARDRIEHGLEIVASEIDTLQRLYDQLAPSSRHDPTVDINAKIQKIGSEMLAKASVNDKNLNQALKMVQTALTELSDERAKLQQATFGLAARKRSLGPDIDEDDVSTASEDVVDKKSGALQARASGVLKRDEPEELQSPPYRADRFDKATTGLGVNGEFAPTQRLRRAQPEESRKEADLRVDECSPRQPHSLRQTRARETRQQKALEHRTTEKNGVDKTNSPRAPARMSARRLAFIDYTKQTEMRFRAQKPRNRSGHKDFIWEYIDNMEDQIMSAVVQRMMIERFPEDVSRSKGRGKPGREMVMKGELEWPQLFSAIKTMPIPRFLQNDV